MFIYETEEKIYTQVFSLFSCTSPCSKNNFIGLDDLLWEAFLGIIIDNIELGLPIYMIVGKIIE